jgi:serine/threonine protein kinase
VAGQHAALHYTTLPVGFELTIELQKLTVDADSRRVKDTQAVGSARVRLERLLSHGGFADAYLCQLCSYSLTAVTPVAPRQRSYRAAGPREQVVIKLLHPLAEPLPDDTNHQHFLQQATAIMWHEYHLLDLLAFHPNITDTYGFGAAAAADASSLHSIGPSMPCILLERAEFGDLWQQVRPSAGVAVPMTAKETHHMMTDVVRALEGLHRIDYIHRDVKPRNVLVFKTPRLNLLTYKLTDLGLAEHALKVLRNDGDGTAAYRPPEDYWFLS